MSNYTFSTLNDKEFEILVRDLLNAESGMSLQSFKTGRDKGVDLRYSTNDNANSIVVQVKHYVRSQYSQFKSVLLNHEVPKVKKLHPDRYIVVTSLSLSAQQKDEIRIIMNPYVITSNDVMGLEDLNRLLDKFPDIQKNHYKLWFSSFNVLANVLNNAINGRTKHIIGEIEKKISFYVNTHKLKEANEILQKHKVLLISGQPGIGKTTLAEIMLFERAIKNHQVFAVENITEAENMISPDDDQAQLFYFDDFLGSNYLEILNADKTETQLTRFIARIRNTPNKYLILTTRTVILNHALSRYEKIGLAKTTMENFELKLTDYNKFEKALILYNHLFFRGVNEVLRDGIKRNQFYREIINHKNYTPRIIEFVTEKRIIENFSAEEYRQFILNNLNNPEKIWKYSFNNQIGYLDQVFLYTLFSFETNPSEKELMEAFNSRLDYEKKNNNQVIRSGQFHESVKVLLNGFISTSVTTAKEAIRQYRFINPSLPDFLINQVSESYSELKSIISSLKYVHQLARFNPSKSKFLLEHELQTIIRDLIVEGRLIMDGETEQHSDTNRRLVGYMETLCRYCSKVNIDSIVLEHLKQLSMKPNWYGIRSKMEFVLLNLGDSPMSRLFVRQNFIEIIGNMISTAIDAEDAMNIPEIFEEFEQSYDEFVESSKGFDAMLKLIRKLSEESVEASMEEFKTSVTEYDEVESIYDELYSSEEKLISVLFPNISFDFQSEIEIDEDFWRDRILINSREAEEEDYYNEHRSNYYKNSGKSEEQQIDDLFS